MNNSINPLFPVNPQGLDDIARSLLQASPPLPPEGKGNINSSQEYWRVEGVSYRGKETTIDLAKTLLDEGNAKTQEDWSIYSKEAKERNDFYTGSFPLYHSLFTKLYKLKDDSAKKQVIDEARSFLEKQFKEHWLMSLTRIHYTTQGKDKTIHDYGLASQWEKDADMVGKDEWVKSATDKEVYNALLESNNVQEINNVYNWITGKDAYLWRVNSKPCSPIDRVAGFDADSGRAVLDCDWVPSYSGPSLGVREAHSAEATQRKNQGGNST